MIAFNRRTAKTPLSEHTPKMSEDAASLIARTKAELQVVRAGQRCTPEDRKARAIMMEATDTYRREREAARVAKNWL
jgi:hypothetical protein